MHNFKKTHSFKLIEIKIKNIMLIVNMPLKINFGSRNNVIYVSDELKIFSR